MFKSKKSKSAADAAPERAQPNVDGLPVIPTLDAVEGSVIRADDDDVHDAAQAHAARLLASRDPLTSPDLKYKVSTQRAVSGDRIAIEMGLPGLVSEPTGSGASCPGLAANEWVSRSEPLTPGFDTSAPEGASAVEPDVEVGVDSQKEQVS